MIALKSYYDSSKIEVGLDEVGRGCLAGPVVAAAVILPKDYQNKFLNDSKKMSAKTRVSLDDELKEVALAWSIQEVSPQEIDKINILNASFLAMHRCLDALSLKPELLLVDGNRFKQYQDLPHVCIVKGDGKYLSIAAASVLAKNYRDNLMAEKHLDFPYYDWIHNVGYPTKKHRKGIEEHGSCSLHRKSFKLLSDQLEIF